MFFWIDLIYTMEYSSARRKDEILLFVIIWMDPFWTDLIYLHPKIKSGEKSIIDKKRARLLA